MQPFDYGRPGILSEALALVSRHGSDACLLAGGTDVVVGLRNRSLNPKVVIDLKHVAELRPAIVEDGGRLTVNATTVLTDLGDDERIRARFPALVEAMATVGSNQIRNRATLTGNICHASPAADTAPPLLAYRARVSLASVRGTRRVNLDEFFVGPGKTVLQRGELAVSIDLPIPAERMGAT